MKTSIHQFKPRTLPALLCAGAALLSNSAMAVNGIQLGGNGINNALMGGTSIALPLDAMAAANNPAGMAFVPSSYAADLQFFQGNSTSNYVMPGNQLSNNTSAVVPEGGFNWVLNPRVTLGLTVTGSGVGTDYGKPALPVPGAANAKSNLQNVEIIPNATWKINPDLAVGFGLNIVDQTFNAQGVIAPTPGGPVALPNHGTQEATGVSYRLGVLWQVSPELALGASYKSRTDMGALGSYQNDLLAYSGGKLDLPEQYGIGISWKPVDHVTLAADWLTLNWSGVPAMQDPAGFYWHDQPVVRTGIAWDINPTWTLRAGISNNQGQIPSSNAAQNLLAPSINQTAYTAGATYRLDPKSDISAGVESDPATNLTGTGASAGTSLSSNILIFMVGYKHAF